MSSRMIYCTCVITDIFDFARDEQLIAVSILKKACKLIFVQDDTKHVVVWVFFKLHLLLKCFYNDIIWMNFYYPL